MSSVPYIFASQTGNIPLSELDANFANVKANVDYASSAGHATTATTATSATSATSATTAIRVTASAQPNITSVGSTLTVSGNITIGNVITGGEISATGNITSAANVAGGNILSSGLISVTGNAQFGNTRAVAMLATGSFNNQGLEIATVNYANITANAANTTLSTTISRNILVANNTGYTHTINMPTSPVDGQLSMFSISGNTVILVVGTGTVTPTFAGSTTAGTGYTYVYLNSGNTWYRTS
jgi:hypothetical protein